MQNGFIESFNGRLRDELLNETLFTSLARARVALASWRTDYNLPEGVRTLRRMLADPRFLVDALATKAQLS
jgi:transposase InsO family protein